MSSPRRSTVAATVVGLVCTASCSSDEPDAVRSTVAPPTSLAPAIDAALTSVAVTTTPSSTPPSDGPAPAVSSLGDTFAGLEFFCGDFGSEHLPRLLALDPSTGAPMWRICATEPPAFDLGLVGRGDGVTLVTTGMPPGELIAVDDEGATTWTHPMTVETGWNVILASEAAVFLGDEVEAVDTATGDVLWTHASDVWQPIAGTAEVLVEASGGPYAGSDPVPSPGRQRVQLRGLDPSSADVLWTIDVLIDGSMQPSPYSPTLTRDLLVLPQVDGTTVLYDALTGGELRTVDGYIGPQGPGLVSSSPDQGDPIDVVSRSDDARVPLPDGTFPYLVGSTALPGSAGVVFARGLPEAPASLDLIDTSTLETRWSVDGMRAIGQTAGYVVTAAGSRLDIIDAATGEPQSTFTAPTDLVDWRQAVGNDSIVVVAPSGPLGFLPTDGAIAPELPVDDGTDRPDLCPADELPAWGALSLADGTVQWAACSSAKTYRAMIGAGAEVVLGMESGDTAEVVALSATDGTELWRQPVARIHGLDAGPADAGGIVVVDRNDAGAVVAGLDAITGDERWRLEPGLALLATTETTVVAASASDPSLPGIRALDRATGEGLWTSDVSYEELANERISRGSVAVTGDVLAVASGSSLTGIDIRTGEELWTTRQLDHPVAAGDAFVGQVPTQSGGGTIRAIDAATGETRWEASGQAAYGTTLAAGDEGVYVIEGDGITAYELADGSQRWHVAATVEIGQPQLVSGSTLVLLWERVVGGMSTADGSVTWSANTPLWTEFMNSVVADDDTVYIAANSLPWGD